MKKITPIALSAALLLTAVPVNAAEISESTRQTADYMMAKNDQGVPNWFWGVITVTDMRI